MSDLKKILFFGELPPFTVHGASISNDINLNMLSSYFNISIVNEIYLIKNHKSGYFYKFFLFLKSYFNYLVSILSKKYEFYYGVFYFSTFGVIKNILLVLIFKAFNPQGIVILHIHRSDFNIFTNNYINYLLVKFLNIFTNKYILLSRSQIEEIKVLPQDKFYILNNTIQTEFNFPLKLPKRVDADNALKLIYVGNFIREKGVIELIQAITLLNDKSKRKVELEMFGSFASEGLKTQILSLTHGSNSIKISEPIYDNLKFKKLYDSDLLVLPSYNEGLPLVLLESMSVGTPVIISNVGYISDVLGDSYPFFCIPKSYSSIVYSIEKYFDFNDKLSLNELIIEKYNKYSRENHYKTLLKIFDVEN